MQLPNCRSPATPSGAVALLLAAAFIGLPAVAFGEDLARTATSTADVTALLRQLQAQHTDALERLAELEAAQEDMLGASTFPESDGGLVRLYGFFEAGAQKLWSKTNGFLNSATTTNAATFLQGDLHLYLDVAPSPSWRGLVEARITASNGGNDLNSDTYRPISTAVLPVNRSGVGIGGQVIGVILALERAYIEHTFRDEIGLRVGLWLTPWGIWNVDHGSPTLIPLIEPYFQSFQMFPTQQLGISAFGQVHLLPWTVEYSVGISNGRIAGPATLLRTSWPSFDVTEDKMFSGRISARRTGQDELQFGLSAYWGRSATQAKTVSIVDRLSFEESVDLELEEWGVGGDFAYDRDHLRLRLEFTYTQYRYHGRRPRSFWYPLELAADSAQVGGYFLVSTPFRWLDVGLEPYLYTEVIWWPSVIPADFMVAPSLGANIDFTTQVRLKFQYILYRFLSLDDGGIDFDRNADDVAHTVGIRLVVSF